MFFSGSSRWAYKVVAKAQPDVVESDRVTCQTGVTFVSPSLTISVSEAAALLVRDLDIENLVAHANEARTRAYAPYSNLRIGAAILTVGGQIVSAGNVENASYGATICAERSVVVRAVAEGHREFAAIAIAGDTDQVHTLASCGVCLQVLAEFDADESLVVMFPEGDSVRVSSLSELLPVRFRLQSGE
jgi:cytidine deaminase